VSLLLPPGKVIAQEIGRRRAAAALSLALASERMAQLALSSRFKNGFYPKNTKDRAQRQAR